MSQYEVIRVKHLLKMMVFTLGDVQQLWLTYESGGG